MVILLALEVIVGLVMLIISYRKAHELPNSVSMFSYYSGKNLFSYWMLFNALMLIYPTSYVLGADKTYIAWIQSSGLILVAVSPDFKHELRVMHYVGGYLFGIVSQVIVFMTNPILFIGWVFMILPLLKKSWIGNNTIVAEIICLFTLIVSLLMEIL